MGLSVVLCMKTAAEPQLVREIAISKKWKQVRSEDAPGYPPALLVDSKSYTPASIWTFEYGSTQYWLRLADFSESPNVKFCSLAAFNLDPRIVHAQFGGNSEVDAPSLSKVPALNYTIDDYPGLAQYTLEGNSGEVLHTVTFIPKSRQLVRANPAQ
jgi:hypothetical protein